MTIIKSLLDQRAFAVWVKDKRVCQDLSQAQLAKKLGIWKSTISRLERSERQSTDRTVKMFEKFFNERFSG